MSTNRRTESRPFPRRFRLLIRSGLLLSALGALVTAPADAQRPEVEPALREMERQAGGPVLSMVSPVTGLATWVSVPPERAIPVSGALLAGAPAEERARAFLRTFGAAFGIEAHDQLEVRRSSGPDRVGMEHVRFEQVVQGVAVTGGELSVHLRDGAVVAVNARTLPDLAGFDVHPSLSAPEATERVEALLPRLGLGAATRIGEPALRVLDRGLLEARKARTDLAWFVEITGPAVRQYVWIDAHSGALLLSFSQLPHARNRLVYDANDSFTLPGTLVRSEGGVATGDADADLAYDFSGDTYDYFLGTHGRDSYDDGGATLHSTVHFCPETFSGSGIPDCPFLNAFWNGNQMVYGEGFSAADDVVAHELTHAVTDHSARLFYYMQSGALNEAFSDIFGETVDLLNGAGNDDPSVRWQIGEDVPVFGAFRDMMDPTVFGDPGKMTDAEFVCETPGGDGGGLHSNSGVPNHAYALMVDGGTYNGRTVTGIGLDKAGRIHYRALTEYLLSASDFLDHDQALRQSCSDLVGTDGITIGDCAQVGAALDAVEMSHPWPCLLRNASEPLLCPNGGVPSDLFVDDFETVSSGNWNLDVIAGVDHWGGGEGDDGLYWQDFATSGIYHLWGFNFDSAGDTAVVMTSGVALPANARAQFRHSFGFEEDSSGFYDGGVVEYSTGGGTSWTDAGNLMVAGARYGGNLAGSTPLGTAPAFVGDSHGYTATQLDLSSLAGQTVRLRFRMATDAAVSGSSADYGWFVDDVRVYSCSGATVLHDHTDSPVAYGITSQKFEPVNEAFTNMAAADFSSGSPSRLGGATVPGIYSAGAAAAGRVNVLVTADAGGFPGAELCSYQGLRAGVHFSDTAGTFAIELPSPCCLPAGTHWLGVQADQSAGESGQWFWLQRTVASGAVFAWRNPGDGFATGCVDWSSGPTCLAPDAHPDLRFLLWEAPSPAVPATLDLVAQVLDQRLLYEATGAITAEDVRIEPPAEVTLRGGSVAFGSGFGVATGASLRVSTGSPTGCP
ncbi:MAG TPA: M4 family metallopeptidase [Thermoanaerobaculia bacterium]|nr:M4 family metallopeptidase [Thermoanaerobaculia bacterium]